MFVIQCIIDSNGTPIPAETPHYLYKSVSKTRQGYMKLMITPNVEQARSWQTRAGAEGYLTRLSERFTVTQVEG